MVGKGYSLSKTRARNIGAPDPGCTAEEAMTPIESTFSLDVNSKLDWEVMGKILARGHSRVPVYSGNPRNVIGLLLVDLECSGGKHTIGIFSKLNVSHGLVLSSR